MSIQDTSGPEEQPAPPVGMSREKLIGGLCLVALGLVAIWESLRYPLGSIRSIGPGYFPLCLGVITALLGAAFLWEARNTPRDAGPVAWRGLLAVMAAMAAFGLLIERAGALAAIVALVAIAGLAEPRYRLRPVAVVAASLCLFLVVIKWLIGPTLTIPLI